MTLHVLFVCTANICRSAYAESWARATGAPGLTFASAGTHARNGSSMDPAMVRQLAERDVPAPPFASRPATPAEVSAADVVLTMTSAHRTFLLDDQPSAIGRIFTLGQFVERAEWLSELRGTDLVAELGTHRTRSRPHHDVEDPYGLGDDAARTAATRIGHLVDAAIAALTPPAPGR